MLKNFINNINIRNFKQSSFYFDFLIKKILFNFFKNLLNITLLFLEKYILDFLPKNIKNNIIFVKNNINFNFFKTIIYFLNILLFLLFL